MATKRELENEILKQETLEAGKKIFANKYTEIIVFGMVGVILLAFATVWVNSYVHAPVGVVQPIQETPTDKKP